jgi:hypothetical protein
MRWLRARPRGAGEVGCQVAAGSLPGDYNLYFAALRPNTFDFISLTTTIVRAQ